MEYFLNIFLFFSLVTKMTIRFIFVPVCWSTLQFTQLLFFDIRFSEWHHLNIKINFRNSINRRKVWCLTSFFATNKKSKVLLRLDIPWICWHLWNIYLVFTAECDTTYGSLWFKLLPIHLQSREPYSNHLVPRWSINKLFGLWDKIRILTVNKAFSERIFFSLRHRWLW